ncbi:hypothetical protein ACJX0J_005989, partial [Zea mays]
MSCAWTAKGFYIPNPIWNMFSKQNFQSINHSLHCLYFLFISHIYGKIITICDTNRMEGRGKERSETERYIFSSILHI